MKRKTPLFVVISLLFPTLLWGTQREFPNLTDKEIVERFYDTTLSRQGMEYQANSYTTYLLGFSAGRTCVDSLEEARRTVEKEFKNSKQDIVVSKDRTRFFEFIFYIVDPVHKGHPAQTTLRSVRVYNCSYSQGISFAKMGMPEDHSEDVPYSTSLGQMEKPLNKAEWIGFLHELWTVPNMRVVGRAILSADDLILDEKGMKWSFYESYAVYGDWGVHDQISIWQTTFAWSPTNKTLTVESRPFKKLQGRKNSGGTIED